METKLLLAVLLIGALLSVDGLEARRLPPLKHARKLLQDDAGAADSGSTGTSRTVYTPTFSSPAGELGRLNTYNSDGDNTVQNCYTAPGVARQCNGKKKK